MRDPYIHQGPDGRFHMVWTTGWRGRGIGYAWSDDLLHWSEQRELPVMGGEPSAQNCWAPEILYDRERGVHLLYWSSTIPGRFPETEDPGHWNHRIYCAETADFRTLGDTELLVDPGFNAIDADILERDGRWLLFLKNETEPPLPLEKNIRFLVAAGPRGPYGPASAPITGDYWAEGPCAVAMGDGVTVFFDKHRERRYGAVRSTDLRTWEDISDRLIIPPPARHGHVFAVAEPVLAALLRHRPARAGGSPGGR